MRPCCYWLSALTAMLALVISALAVVFIAYSIPGVDAADKTPAAQPIAGGRSWPMLGGSPQRNMVNTVEKSIATEWDVKEGAPKNIKWVAQLGTKGYGCAIVSGGKVFVG